MIFNLGGDEVDQWDAVDAGHPKLRQSWDNAQGPWVFPTNASLGINLNVPGFPFIEDAEGVVVSVAFHTALCTRELGHGANCGAAGSDKDIEAVLDRRPFQVPSAFKSGFPSELVLFGECKLETATPEAVER